MRKSFDVNLSPQETAAIVNYFDKEGKGQKIIYCKDFINFFFRCGHQERERFFSTQSQKTHKRNLEDLKRVEDVKARFGKLKAAKMVPATDEDRENAWTKIRKAALSFKSESFFGNIIQKSFETSILDPSGTENKFNNK